VSSIVVPTGLVIVVVLLTIGFFVSMAGTMRLKAEEAKKYKKIANLDESQFTNGGSYQQQSVGQYSIPSKQKDVTYCVIDGRLIDS
jgi:hypothetical protein